ncbi:MAG: hypothetical protein ACI4BI_06685 [Anaerotardibacter sp.]
MNNSYGNRKQRAPQHAKQGALNPKQKLARTAVGSVLAVSLVVPLAGISQIANADPQVITQGVSTIVDGSEQKKEIVYGKLGSTGSVEGLYVVNMFEQLNVQGENGVANSQASGAQSGDAQSGDVQTSDSSANSEMLVRDYGAYSSVVNLSDNQELALSGDSVCFTSQDQSFSYQGNLTTTDLPWLVDVQYYLDGTAIAPEDLAGKSGLLTIKLSISQNTAVDSSYFDNYLVQASVTLPQDKATQVATEDGSIAVSGSNTQVTFMSLPGKESTSTLTAQVTDFEMDGISVAAVPFSMDISFSADGLTSGFDELVEGTKELNEGAQAIKQGSSALEVGAAQLAAGSSQLDSQGQALLQGVGSYLSSARQISEGVAALSSQSQALVSGAEKTQYALNMFVDSLTQEQLNAMSAEQKQLLYGAQAGLNGSSAGGFTGNTSGGSEGASGSASSGSAGLVNGIKAYTNAVTGSGSATNPSIAQSLAALTSNNSTLSASLDSYQQGVSSLTKGLQELSGSAKTFQSGTEGLAEGTEELFVATQGIPDKVQREIDSALAAFDTSSFEPHSFVSDKNTDVSLVQFVMTTEGISLPEEKVEEVEEPEPSIFDRLLALFA